jgi:hypothetical protein
MIDPKFLYDPEASVQPLERESQAAPCTCGGFMDRQKATREEIEAAGDCKRDDCCVVAFVCRVCRDRSIVVLPAPEMQ